MTEFIGQFGDLCIEIDKTKILYDEDVIYDGNTSDKNPAYVMYRDGLRWLEFVDGISREELTSLFQTFHHFRESSEEAEDDLVSALWRLDLRHIFYKASDEFWDDEPTLDFSGNDILSAAGDTYCGEEVDEDQMLEAILEDRNTGRPEDAMAAREEKAKALRLLDQIDPREANILKLHYGLDGKKPMSLKEIGKKLGLTRERIRQLRRDALTTLYECMNAE